MRTPSVPPLSPLSASLWLLEVPSLACPSRSRGSAQDALLLRCMAFVSPPINPTPSSECFLWGRPGQGLGMTVKRGRGPPGCSHSGRAGARMAACGWFSLPPTPLHSLALKVSPPHMSLSSLIQLAAADLAPSRCLHL